MLSGGEQYDTEDVTAPKLATRSKGHERYSHKELKCACTKTGAKKQVTIKSRSQATEKNIEGGVEKRNMTDSSTLERTYINEKVVRRGGVNTRTMACCRDPPKSLLLFSRARAWLDFVVRGLTSAVGFQGRETA